jgi:hypothetical protein
LSGHERLGAGAVKRAQAGCIIITTAHGQSVTHAGEKAKTLELCLPPSDQPPAGKKKCRIAGSEFAIETRVEEREAIII